MAKDLEIFYGDGNVVFRGTCTVTSQLYEVRLSKDAFRKWQSGTVIQEAAPELDNDQREFLISRMTPAEFDDLFPPEEEQTMTTKRREQLLELQYLRLGPLERLLQKRMNESYDKGDTDGFVEDSGLLLRVIRTRDTISRRLFPAGDPLERWAQDGNDDGPIPVLE